MHEVNFQNSYLPQKQLCKQGRDNSRNVENLSQQWTPIGRFHRHFLIQSQWDNEKERLKGRSTEVLSTNLQLDNIPSGLHNIFRKLEMREDLLLERIKSEFLGKQGDIETFMQLFDKHNSDVSKQVGSSGTLQKYNAC